MKNETARREIESLDYYLQNHTNDYSEESHTAMMMAIKALKQEPCEDCISREAVHAKVLKEWNNPFPDEDVRFSAIADFVIDSPSVTPARKKGKWIVEPGIGCKCSECGKPPYPYQTDSSSDDYWKPDYCPNCGTEMESEEV